jgi:hypothetical protein
MTLRRSAVALPPAARSFAVLSVLAALGIGLAASNTEDVVAGRFAAALEQTPRQVQVSVDNETGAAPVSGSEAYWLASKRRADTNGAALEPATWAPLVSGLSVVDRIAISSGKSERVLEVVAIANIEPAADLQKLAGHVAVTCRDLSTPDRAFTTFLVPAGSSLGGLKTARAL